MIKQYTIWVELSEGCKAPGCFPVYTGTLYQIIPNALRWKRSANVQGTAFSRVFVRKAVANAN